MCVAHLKVSLASATVSAVLVFAVSAEQRCGFLQKTIEVWPCR